MSNGIKKLEKVSCSLRELGYVYNLNYSFVPQQGVRLTLYFVNESGEYKTGFLSSSSKVQISIGDAGFSLYPIKLRKITNGTERSLAVDFVDDTFRLNNYYISLKDNACGDNVFSIGEEVNKTGKAILRKSDPSLEKIKDFTTFSDVEYTFSDFISVLRRVFPVAARSFIDNEITRPFEGTFLEVLNSWCSYFNYSYFFDENGILTIADPSTLEVEFPDIPADAISSDYQESIEDTYDKTVWSIFKEDGKEIPLKGELDNNFYLKSLTLFPWENLRDIKDLNDSLNGTVDPLQLAAAQYGKEFWFLYNYYNGSAEAECGFSVVEVNDDTIDAVKQADKNIKESLTSTSALNFLDKNIFEQNYQKYYSYGRNIAGRYYVSNSISGILNFNRYTWFDTTTGGSFTKESLFKRPSANTNLYQNPPDKQFGVIADTEGIPGYNGLALNSRRFFVKDNESRDYDTFFQLEESVKNEVELLFSQVSGGKFGSVALNLGADKVYAIFDKNILYSSSLTNVFLGLPDKVGIFSYRYKRNFQITGYLDASDTNEDYNKELADGDIKITTDGPTVFSNSSVIKTKRDSEYVAYCSKYISCKSSSSRSGAMNRKFESISPSIDIELPISVRKTSRGAIIISRDTSLLKKYQNSNILSSISRPFNIIEKRLEYTLNYFEPFKENFLTKGLVGISISISSSGASVTYSYSNEILRVPTSSAFIEKIERSIKNSYKRKYNPTEQQSI